MARDHRRLAAIVSADVVGYSLLMGRDDSATLAGLKAHRQELIDPKIAEYGGRIVKTTGDGLLLEFPSVVDAVRCAVDVQRGMAERNAGVPPEQRIEFRVGVNVGDIIIDGDDIFGDGVNVAARLQTLAEPGGICVSRVVRDQVLDKLSFTFQDLGAQEVKNIARPVEVYRVALESGAPPLAVRRRWRHLRRVAGWQWLAAAAMAFVLVGSAVWYLFIRQTTAAPPGPPLMSVAVMPFTPASASADDEGLAERMTQDLTTAMEHSMRSALVVSHGLAAKYKDPSLDPRAVGHDLNVRYLVEGNVRNTNGELVVMARLVETTNGTQVWSVQQAGSPPAANEAAGHLVGQLTSRLRNALYEAEKKRVAQLPKSGANARELVLRANALWDQDPSPKGRDAARKVYEEALRHDPGSASALLGLFRMIWRQRTDDPSADREQLLKELDDVSKRAVRADRDDPRAWSIRAAALAAQFQWDAAFEANAEALRIDPYHAGSLEDRAWLLIVTGRAQEALPVLDQAIALDPRSPGVPHFLQNQCYAYLLLGRYDNAISACEKALALEDNLWRRFYLVAAYAQKGDMAKAAVEKAELLKWQPNMTIASVVHLSNNPIVGQQWQANVLPGLRKGGIPEN